MTTQLYLYNLEKLGLTPHSKRTAELLGLSRRQVQRLAAGASVPEPVEKLIRMYLEHGLPDD